MSNFFRILYHHPRASLTPAEGFPTSSSKAFWSFFCPSTYPMHVPNTPLMPCLLHTVSLCSCGLSLKTGQLALAGSWHEGLLGTGGSSAASGSHPPGARGLVTSIAQGNPNCVQTVAT